MVPKCPLFGGCTVVDGKWQTEQVCNDITSSNLCQVDTVHVTAAGLILTSAARTIAMHID